MEIKHEQINETVKVEIDGDINSDGSRKLAQTLEDIRNLDDYQHVVFDMKDVKIITSAGIGKILNFFKHLDTSERTMEIKGISDILYLQFKEIHLDRIFPINK